MTLPLVLVADDNRLVRSWVTARLAAEGLRTATARNGVEVLALADREEPDLFLVDLVMSGPCGSELVTRIRERPGSKTTPIIVLSAAGHVSSRIELLGAGANDYVSKSVVADELIARVRVHLRSAGITQRLRAERDEARSRVATLDLELSRTSNGLVSALECVNLLNDSDTGEHIRRIGTRAAALARAAGASDDFARAMERYAGLHDVGKVGIRDSILKKPGRLTADEFEEMKGHTSLGADLITAAALPPLAANIARHHHERWDGEGYPGRLRGADTPLEARIVAVVDVYDALRSPRCYKPAYTTAKSRKMLERFAGSQLDPELVPLFLSWQDDFDPSVSVDPDNGLEAAAPAPEPARYD